MTVGARYFDKEFLWKFFREEMEKMREATFIDEWLEEKLEEGLQQGLQQGLERGIERGIEQGIQQEKQRTRWLILMRILRRHFGELPLSLEERLGTLSADALDQLIDVALDVPDMATFYARLDEISAQEKQRVGVTALAGSSG